MLFFFDAMNVKRECVCVNVAREEKRAHKKKHTHTDKIYPPSLI